MFLVIVMAAESPFLLPNIKCYYAEAPIGEYSRSGFVVYLWLPPRSKQTFGGRWLMGYAGRD